jgi:hypothetical protein
MQGGVAKKKSQEIVEFELRGKVCRLLRSEFQKLRVGSIEDPSKFPIRI